MASTGSLIGSNTASSVQQDPSQPLTTRLGKRAARNKAVKDAVAAGDWNTLEKLSTLPGGLQEARSTAWPFLLHATPSAAAPRGEGREDAAKKSPPTSSQPHNDERQVVLDTNRAFVHYPTESQQSKERRKKQLTDIILGVLERHPQLSYFQGYHDIISTLQLTLHPSVDTDEEALRVLRACAVKISLHRARDAMGAGLQPLTGQLRILRRLIRIADPELAYMIEDASPLPYWAVSPLMTLYTHDLPTLELAQRVMDWILCRPPDAVIHLVAAFTLEKKDGVKKLIEEGDDGMMHSFLSNLPELEADELEPEVENRPIDGTRTPPARGSGTVIEGETTSTEPSIVDDSSTLHSPTETPLTSGRTTPLIRENAGFGSDTVLSCRGALDSERLDLIESASSSPKSSTSSLPVAIASSKTTLKSMIPLSSILQKADQLRNKYPITHKALRLKETMGPDSMLLTWSTNPQAIPEDSIAEEKALATDQVVLPDLDDDLFEPYSPQLQPVATKTRSRLDMRTALSIGIPAIAVIIAVTSNSPTARAGAWNTIGFAWTIFEFIWRRLRFEPLPALDIYD